MKKTILCTAFVFLACAARAGENKQAPLIVHEWGTFTSLQDEQGNAIGGINVDDEPVPDFVWGAYAVRGDHHKDGAYADFGLPPHFNFSKGWTPADQDVTMRLETPVIYFY